VIKYFGNGETGYMQIEEARSENGKGGVLGHVHLILCTSYFNRHEEDYPVTRR
jgi:hypothetical protein